MSLRATSAAVVALVAALAVAGCGSGAARGGGDRLTVVATTTQLADFARQVGGQDVRVVQLLKANTDPHDYEPRPADVRETAGAKVILTSGDDLDAWMGDVVEQSGTSARTVDVGATVPDRRPGEADGPEASRYDPHWWHDPRNAQAAVATIRDALVRADADRAEAFRANARTYLAKVRRLDRGIAACVSAVPVAERKLVTDHDAFGYFAKRYGIDVVGAVIPSQTTQAQPNAKALAELVAVVRRERVRAVFPESSVNARLARAIARETGADASATLYGDSLGPEGSSGATYLAMEQANAAAMVDGFTGGRAGCPIAGL